MGGFSKGVLRASLEKQLGPIASRGGQYQNLYVRKPIVTSDFPGRGGRGGGVSGPLSSPLDLLM